MRRFLFILFLLLDLLFTIFRVMLALLCTLMLECLLLVLLPFQIMLYAAFYWHVGTRGKLQDFNDYVLVITKDFVQWIAGVGEYDNQDPRA
ncbi:MAG: hypothetical protein GZ088_15985 [Acidipila sp.]|nr:hypothetical protein [Acidipila sp.]